MNKSKAKFNNALFEVLRTLIAIVIALLIVIVIVLLISDNPWEAMAELLLGPVKSAVRIGNVLELMIPLSFCGLAISLTFRAKQYNLVADSAFYAGGLVACIVGIFSPLPPGITIILCMLAGSLVGCVLGYIPAIMKVKFGAMELVSSLMLNYIVGYIGLYIFNNPIRDVSKSTQQSMPLKDGVLLAKLFPESKMRIHWGLFIMLACVIVCTIMMFRMKKGYELRMTGSNENFAFYSGIRTSSVVIGAQVIGAGIAGLGGSVEILGMYSDAFRWVSSPGYGFDGVIIAALAHNNPGLVPFCALFLAYIRVGADAMNRSSDILSEIISIIQATIILLIAAQAFLGRWKQKMVVKQTIGGSDANEEGSK